METGTVYIYDGNIQGFLTALGEALDAGAPVAGICRAGEGQPALFAQTRRVFTHRPRAEQLWRKLEKKSASLTRIIYFSYLSENPDIEIYIYRYLHLLFNINESLAPQLTQMRQRLESVARRVEGEKRELERTLSFTDSLDGISCALACPAYNILPLLTRHFKSRFGGQAWLVYDLRRNFGIFWHGGQMELVGLRKEALGSFATPATWDKAGIPDVFQNCRLQALLLPKVLHKPRGAREPEPIRSAV